MKLTMVGGGIFRRETRPASAETMANGAPRGLIEEFTTKISQGMMNNGYTGEVRRAIFSTNPTASHSPAHRNPTPTRRIAVYI